MSGLFRRLVQHATDRATTLHASARLPFHAAPERLADTNAGVPDVEPSPIAAPTQTLQTRATRSQQTTAPRQTHGEVSPPESTPTAAHASQEANHTERTDPPRKTALGTPPPAHRANVTSRDDDAHEPGAPDTSSESVTVPRSLMLEPHFEDGPSAATNSIPQDGATNARAAQAPVGTAAPESEFPPPLMTHRPDAPAIEPAIRPPSNQRESQRRHREPEQAPNEVHVHIGRIEVTAVQESAPAPRKKKNGRAPMSLNEYLAKRQRGSS